MDDYLLIKDLIDKSEYSEETKTFLSSQLARATSTELLLSDLSEKQANDLKYKWYTLELDMKHKKLPKVDVDTNGYDLLIGVIDMLFEQTIQKATLYRPLLFKKKEATT
jgi:hypothetical protein